MEGFSLNVNTISGEGKVPVERVTVSIGDLRKQLEAQQAAVENLQAMIATMTNDESHVSTEIIE